MLTLQVGQCGNQLGRAFFSALARDDDRVTGDATDLNGSAFFRAFDPCARGALNRPVARAVLVDMEPKVVAQCLSGNATTSSAHAAFAYDPRNVLTQQSGSGNNWALGYAGHGARLADALDDLLQRVGAHVLEWPTLVSQLYSPRSVPFDC
jgi:tubulin delta